MARTRCVRPQGTSSSASTRRNKNLKPRLLGQTANALRAGKHPTALALEFSGAQAGDPTTPLPSPRPNGMSRNSRAGKKKTPSTKRGERIRFDTQGPPDGYAFVPKGDVYVTRHCRLQTHESGRTVYVVYSPKTNTQRGLYVPRDVRAAVLASARETAASRSVAVAQKDARDERRARMLLERGFPAMPEDDLHAVLGHAFRKRSGRVGRSGTVRDEETKVRLAVEAHIRHVHTEYESLLRSGVEKSVAREQVWGKVKEIKEQWEKGKEDLLE
ncbi:hypothetical protein VTO42DRAFT_1897 [Malbranchea cinnamomea]